MLSSTAIVSLACLLSTGEMDMGKTVEGLSPQETAKVQAIIDSGACAELPAAFQKLVKKEPTGVLKFNSQNLTIEREGPPTSDFPTK